MTPIPEDAAFVGTTRNEKVNEIVKTSEITLFFIDKTPTFDRISARGVEKMELILKTVTQWILTVAIVEGICYIPLNKELKKRDLRIWELEERIRKLEQDRQDG